MARRHGHEVRSPVQRARRARHEAQPSLMHERRGLERVRAPLSGQEAGCQPPEVTVDELGQALGGRGVAFGHAAQQIRDLTVWARAAHVR